jgi:hypothetical protein
MSEITTGSIGLWEARAGGAGWVGRQRLSCALTLCSNGEMVSGAMTASRRDGPLDSGLIDGVKPSDERHQAAAKTETAAAKAENRPG